jgi:hypothetical protein
MTTAIARIKSHFLNWREWELNPIVMKELRQAMRNWSVIGMLLLFLAVLFCTALTLLITQTFEMAGDHRVGATIFQVFVGILTGASLLFIPLYVGVRLAAERQETNLDLLYISTLTPGRIIRGKFFCGAYMTVLFFSACMPFMAFTNLLRGVDLPTVGFILICLFFVVCLAIQVAIFFACLPISKLFKILLGLFGVGWVMPIITGLTFAFYQMMRSGIGSAMGRPDFWQGFLTWIGVLLAIFGLLYLLSVALISPPSANRAFALRVYVTGIWIVGGLVSFWWAVENSDGRRLMAWLIPSLILMAVSLIVVISNSDELSLRVRRDIPRQPGKRALAILFFNGAAGGLMWVIGIAAISFLGTWLGWKFMGSSGWPGSDGTEILLKVLTCSLYALSYALTALFLHRKLFPLRPPKLAGIVAIILPAIWALVPNILLFFGNRLSVRSMEASQYGNVFNVFMVRSDDQQYNHLLCAFAWCLVIMFVNGRWFVRQMRAFRPLEKWTAAAAPASASLPPVIPTQPTAS